MKALAAIVQAINGLCSIVPGLVWAIACMVLLAHGALLQHRLDGARADVAAANAKYAALDRAMRDQKAAAGVLYDQLKKKADEQQALLADMLKAQEIKDANHAKAAEAARRALDAAAARNGGRLRDPNAPGCGGGGAGAPGGPGPGAAAGGENAAQAGGLLSAQLSGLLRQLQRDADEVNNAYAACRADSYRSRAQPVPADNDPH